MGADGKESCNLCDSAKYKPNKREIWTAETLMYATEVCEDEILKLAMNLSFSASLRIGELCGLTWDCVDISQEAVEGGTCSIYMPNVLTRGIRRSSTGDR